MKRLAPILLLALPALLRADILDDIAANPPATGPMLGLFLDKKPNTKIDLHPGDIITAVADTPVTNEKELEAAFTAEKGRKKPVDVTIVRAGVSQTIKFPDNRINAEFVDLEKGKSLPLHLSPTKSSFDFSTLKTKPFDQWYSEISGKKKTGYIHLRTELKDGKVLFHLFAAYEERAGSGIVVTTDSAITAEPKPRYLGSRGETTDRDLSNVLALNYDGKGKIEFTASQIGKPELLGNMNVPTDILPANNSEQILAYLDLINGTVLNYTEVHMLGDVHPHASAYVGELTDVNVAGVKLKAIPIETMFLAQKQSTIWVDPDTREILKIEWTHGLVFLPCTRAQAIANIPKSVDRPPATEQ